MEALISLAGNYGGIEGLLGPLMHESWEFDHESLVAFVTDPHVQSWLLIHSTNIDREREWRVGWIEALAAIADDLEDL